MVPRPGRRGKATHAEKVWKRDILKLNDFETENFETGDVKKEIC